MEADEKLSTELACLSHDVGVACNVLAASSATVWAVY